MNHLKGSLFGQPFFLVKLQGKQNKKFNPGSGGMLNPRKAGGVNQTSKGFKEENVKNNPWDYILCTEGALFFQTSVNHRLAMENTSLTAPFTVNSVNAGFGSVSNFESKKQIKKEIWLPVWYRPTGIRELKHLFHEGRTVLGRNKVQNGRDFARAIRTLGIIRGLAGFERTVIREHRGKSLIVKSVGFHNVRYSSDLALLDNLDHCLLPLEKKENQKAIIIYNQVNKAVFACCQKPTPEQFTEILCCVGRAEQMFSLQKKTNNTESIIAPLSGLSLDWLSVADDGSVEFRLAAALASIGSSGKVGGLRANLIPINPQKPTQWSSGTGQCYWFGSNFYQKLSGILSKRLLDAERNDIKKLPLFGKIRLNPQDAIMLATEQINEKKTEELLFAMSVMDWQQYGDWQQKKVVENWQNNPVVSGILPRSWCLFKLFFLPGLTVGGNKVPKGDAQLLSLLNAGRLGDAARIAILKLTTRNLNPYQLEYRDDFDGQCLAASMLVPVSFWQVAIPHWIFSKNISSNNN